MSEKLIIQGGIPLTGVVPISGAKNSVLKLMAASLLTEEDVILNNVPNLTDVNVMVEVVRHLGCKVKRSGSTLCLSSKGITTSTAPYELVSKMRASFNVLGGLLGRCHEARVSLPGGCSIGKRGVDLHIKGLQALGAEVEISHGYVEARATRLVGAEIHLDMPSVGATENIMLTAVLAEGSTIISNAAQEPEIIDLAHFLNAMGADVSGAGTHEIIINGTHPRRLHGAEYHVLPDRIEAATYMIAAAATRGDVILENVVPAHFSSVIYKLTEMGADITTPTPNSLRINVSERLMAQNLVTQPYPGFPTDLQAPFMALLSVADGVSVLTETIYENRFKQVGELKRMGAQIQQEGDVAIITGVDTLCGAPVKASDLRAGAALVIAGLQAQDKTDILDIHHIDRGYEYLVPKLTALGANIRRVSLEEELQQVEIPV